MQRVDIEQEAARAALPLLQQSVEKCMHWFHAHRSDVVLKLHNIALVSVFLLIFVPHNDLLTCSLIFIIKIINIGFLRYVI